MKQRQIKYRAWDGKVMIPDVIYVNPNAIIEEMQGLPPYANVLYRHDIVSIMQYTELNDEDGIEIYEKDIVLYKGRYLTVDFGSYIEAWDGVCPKDGHNAIGWYLVDEEEKCIKSLLVSWGLPNMKGIIVKGNIYENSDLLLPSTT